MKSKIKLTNLKKPQRCSFTINNFESILEKFLEERKADNLSPRTIYEYRSHVELFCRFHRSIDNTGSELNEKSITDYKLYLLDTRKVKATTGMATLF